MIHGKTIFNALSRVSQERVDAIIVQTVKTDKHASELDVANAIMKEGGYRVEFHNIADQHETLQWQADIHAPSWS